MATKKANQQKGNQMTTTQATTPNTNAAPQAAAPVINPWEDAKQFKAKVKELTDKLPNVGKPAIELIAKKALGGKLDKKEIGLLRTHKVKADGSPIALKSGPRSRNEINANGVKSVIEFGGIEGLTKMHSRHGAAVKRPLLQYIKTLTEGSDDRKALEMLYKTMFPATRKGGFAKLDDQKVSKQLRIMLAVGEVAGAGDRVKKEKVTLPDGRVGLFVFKVTAAQPVVAAAPALPSFAAPAPAQA